jgi:hypothetical protein
MYSNAQKKDKLETRKNMRNHTYTILETLFYHFGGYSNIMALEVYLLTKQRSQQCKEPRVDPKLNGP